VNPIVVKLIEAIKMKNLKSKKNKATLIALVLSLAANSHAQFFDMIPGESAEKIAFLSYQSVRYAADANLKIVYVGSNQFEAQAVKSGVTKNILDDAASNQIIVVENSSLDTDRLMKLMAKGNFIISVGGGQPYGADSALAMLTDMDETGHLQKSAASYFADQPYFSATNEDGQTLHSKVSGYFYSPAGSQSFYTSEQSIALAIAQAIKWASHIDRSPFVSKSGGNWVQRHTRNHTHQCYYRLDNGDSELPGQITVQTEYSKQANDNDSDYDYWAIKYQTETDPNQNGPVSRWFTDKLWVISNPQKNIPNAQVLSYSPATSQGTTDTSVDLSFGSGGIGGSIGWSFSAPDIYITNSSSSSADRIGTEFDFNAFKGVGRTPVTVSPGVILRVPQGTTGLSGKLPEEYRAQFIRDWGRFKTKCQASWNL
jgi:hypothetical protein